MIDRNELESMLVDDYKRGHTSFQIDHYIVARTGLTTYGRYMQALRELATRFRRIREVMCDVEDLEAGYPPDDRPTAARRRQDVLAETKTSLNSMYFEFARLFVNARAYREMLGELTPERVVELEREMFLKGLRLLIAQDRLNDRGLTSQTFDRIRALPPKERMEMVALAMDRNADPLREFLDDSEPIPELEPTLEEIASIREHVLAAVTSGGWAPLLEESHAVAD